MQKTITSLFLFAILSFTTHDLISQNHAENKNIIASLSSTGTQKFLILLVNYSDSSQYYTAANFKDLFYNNNYSFQGASGSVKKYFLNNSFNQLTLLLTASICGWINVAHTHNYYTGTIASNNWKNFVIDAIEAARGAYTSLDLSNYDSNSDGIIDGIIIIHQGKGQEYSGSTNDINSYMGDMTADNKVYNGKKIGQYIILPEFYGNTRDMQTPGIICHYIGHLLGLPDMTPENLSNDGLGLWDLMGKGYDLNNGRTPANLTAWEKSKLSWQTPEVISATGSYSLKNAMNNNKSYKINTSTSNEYFLLENRQNNGWDKYLPGHGMLIYHVDGSYISSHLSNNTVNNDATHPGLDIEEADSMVGNSSYNGDPFPGAYNVFFFTDNSIPSAMSWAGTPTSKPVSNIFEDMNDSTIYFDFMDDGPADFNCDYRNAAPGDTIQFFDISGFSADTWAWAITPSTGVTYVDSANAEKRNPRFRFDATGYYTVKMTASGGGNTDIESKHHYIHIDPAYQGIDEHLPGLVITAFPVPASDYLCVRIENGTGLPADGSLFDIMGKQVSKFRFERNNKTIINTAGLVPGCYLLEVKQKNEIVKKKIFISR